MKAQSSSDSPLRNSTPSGKTQPNSSPYAPSVPISLYRELAAELQATKALLESANHQNQQLTHQNQQMRQEVERLVHSALTLQQLANVKLKGLDAAAVAAPPHESPAAGPAGAARESGEPEAIADMLRNQTFRSDDPSPMADDAVPLSDDRPAPEPLLSDELIAEQAVSPSPSSPRVSVPRDMGGLWLAITLMFIVITAFGAGFLVVRPFLQPPNSSR